MALLTNRKLKIQHMIYLILLVMVMDLTVKHVATEVSVCNGSANNDNGNIYFQLVIHSYIYNKQ